MASQTKISIQDLHLHYGDFEALRGITMEIPSHEITAFIGPSGCGKSTCIKTLNRMNDLIPNCRITGNVSIDGEDIYDPRTDVTLLRRRAGMVFQTLPGSRAVMPIDSWQVLRTLGWMNWLMTRLLLVSAAPQGFFAASWMVMSLFSYEQCAGAETM